jgi:hypothetical protein
MYRDLFANYNADDIVGKLIAVVKQLHEEVAPHWCNHKQRELYAKMRKDLMGNPDSDDVQTRIVTQLRLVYAFYDNFHRIMADTIEYPAPN